MDKEDILARSRKENKNRDLAELEALKKASSIAYVVGCIVCMIICAVQWSYTKTINWGCWTANFSILSTVFLVKYLKLRRRHELMMTILEFSMTLFFLTGFIMSLRG